MRTTLSIDDDVLRAARAMAKSQNRTLGQVISDLARRSLQRPSASATRNGIPLLSGRESDAAVTLETVNELRDRLT